MIRRLQRGFCKEDQKQISTRKQLVSSNQALRKQLLAISVELAALKEEMEEKAIKAAKKLK
ncbi:MAG: hypothetical protein U5L72_08475 [Bacteroidales bacterium]|nr:hypothetical protein [Bacteroidales bacterium]